MFVLRIYTNITGTNDMNAIKWRKLGLKKKHWKKKLARLQMWRWKTILKWKKCKKKETNQIGKCKEVVEVEQEEVLAVGMETVINKDSQDRNPSRKVQEDHVVHEVQNHLRNRKRNNNLKKHRWLKYRETKVKEEALYLRWWISRKLESLKKT